MWERGLRHKSSRGESATVARQRHSAQAGTGHHAGRTNIPLERMHLTIQADLTRKASNRVHSHLHAHQSFGQGLPRGPRLFFLERKKGNRRNPGQKRCFAGPSWHGHGRSDELDRDHYSTINLFQMERITMGESESSDSESLGWPLTGNVALR